MRLLIAEDEQMALEGIRQLVPSGFDEIDLAHNGLEALALAKRDRPDLLLCDVRMPKMNGIELSRQLRALYPDLRILFISAYSDKEYLKSALSIQADGYLEKPIDEKELQDYLSSALAGLRSKKRQHDLASLYTRQHLLRSLLGRGDPEQGFSDPSSPLYREVVSAGRYLPISIRMQWPETGAAAQYGFFAEGPMASIIMQISPRFLFASMSEVQLVIVFYGDLPDRTQLRQRLGQLLTALKEANPSVQSVCACIGKPCTDPGSLYARYHEAHMQVRWLCFAGRPQGTISGTAAPLPLPEDRSERFGQLLRAFRLEEAKALIREQSSGIAALDNGSIQDIRAYYELLLSMVLRVNGTERTGLSGARDGTEVLRTFSRIATLQEMARFICIRIDDIKPRPNVSGAENGIVSEVLQVIRQNLEDPDLSLQSISEKVHLSETYLCALFKRQTGQNLHRVITDMRMERAKYLLVNHTRVPEAAARCGFRSASYFQSAFKKHTGLSPAGYVEKYRAQDPLSREEGTP